MPAHPDAVLEEGRQDSTEAKPHRGSLPTELRGRLPTRGSLLNMWHRSNTDAESTTSVCGNSAPWCSFIRLFVRSLARSLARSFVTLLHAVQSADQVPHELAMPVVEYTRQKPGTAVQGLFSVPFWFETKAQIMRTHLLRSFGITCSNRDEMLCYDESWMANDCIELIEGLHAAGREQRPAHREVAQLLQNSHPPLLLDLGQGNQIYSPPIAVNCH